MIFALVEIEKQGLQHFLMVYIVGQVSSRAVAASLVFNYPYARSGASKSKFVAEQLGKGGLLVVLLQGTLPLALFVDLQVLPLLLFLFLLRALLGRFFVKKIGGYTGDCLGGLQQLAELTIYLFFIVYGSLLR